MAEAHERAWIEESRSPHRKGSARNPHRWRDVSFEPVAARAAEGGEPGRGGGGLTMYTAAMAAGSPSRRAPPPRKRKSSSGGGGGGGVGAGVVLAFSRGMSVEQVCEWVRSTDMSSMEEKFRAEEVRSPATPKSAHQLSSAPRLICWNWERRCAGRCWHTTPPGPTTPS